MNCDCHDNGGPTSQLPNEILDKIIDFALTGTDISIIITYNSLCQLGEPFKELTMRYICRLPPISYNNRDTARSGCFSLCTSATNLAHTEIIQRDNSLGTAAWATNVANERGQIPMSVLTASEGVGLQPMVAGLMKRYLDGVYSHLKFSMLIVTAVEVQQ